MFDVLKQQIQKRVNDIEEAIANGEDYVTEMKTTLESGKKELNDTVDRSKNSVQTTAEQAINDVNTTRDNTINKITNLSEETSSYVKNTADTAIQNVTGFSNEAISHVDTKLEEFDQTIANNGFLTPQILDEEIDKLEWQKYKLTNDDGTYPVVSLEKNLDTLHSLSLGSYYATEIPITGSSSTAGFVEVMQRVETVKHITFKPYNSTQIWLKRFYNEWSDWERVDVTQTDTGWIPITIKNGYNKSTIPDYEPSYRLIDFGTHKKVIVRIGVTNLTSGKNTVASIPTELNPYKIYSHGASTIAKIPPKVVVVGGNIEFHPNSSDNYISTDYVIYQDEWII